MTVPRRVSLLYKFSKIKQFLMPMNNSWHEKLLNLLLVAKSYPLLAGLQIIFFLLTKVTILTL